jgi:putative addiction module component (TIGR02574 family)
VSGWRDAVILSFKKSLPKVVTICDRLLLLALRMDKTTWCKQRGVVCCQTKLLIRESLPNLKAGRRLKPRSSRNGCKLTQGKKIKTMPNTLEVITHEVLELPRPQQIRLAHYLLSLDDDSVNPEIEALWENEIEARLKSYREGRMEIIPCEEVKRNISARLRECK